MSKEIIVEINIEGTKLRAFNHLHISQTFNAHHHFVLTVDPDALETTGTHTLQESQKYMGKFVTVCFGHGDAGENAFKGIVTEVSLEQGNGLWGSLVLRGYSPTYLMEGGDHYASFHERKLSDMLDEASKSLASNDMEIINRPLHRSPITYMCQYGESNFAFINRLSATYGEFFYYDGLHLFFGKPEADTIDIVYGEQIERMHLTMRMVPTKVLHYSYNAKDNQLLSATLPSTVAGADPYTESVLQASAKLFSQTVHQPVYTRINNKEQIDQYAKSHMDKLAAGTIILCGHGDEPKLKLGNVIKLKVSQKGLGAGSKDHGEYMITKLEHHIAGIGTYTNSFEAIPASSQPLSFEVPQPSAETQIATVVDNADPEGLGRVRVQMLWQRSKGQQTDWIRVMTGDAGNSGQVSKNRGSVFIPEIGDQVMVGFRYNDPNRPFVLGSLFHGQIAEGGGKDNSLKAIKTRSGHTLEFNDAGEGTSITLKDKNGNCIYFDTQGKHMTITAPETMTFNAKNMAINIDENLTLKVGKDMKTFVDANHTLEIKEKHEISSNATQESIVEDKDLSIKGDLTITTGATEFSSKKGDITIHSAGVAVLQGKKDAKVNKG